MSLIRIYGWDGRAHPRERSAEVIKEQVMKEQVIKVIKDKVIKEQVMIADPVPGEHITRGSHVEDAESG